jgi:hypothetical protein
MVKKIQPMSDIFVKNDYITRYFCQKPIALPFLKLDSGFGPPSWFFRILCRLVEVIAEKKYVLECYCLRVGRMTWSFIDLMYDKKGFSEHGPPKVGTSGHQCGCVLI